MVAWTLSKPGVTGVIGGARSPEQVEGWIGGSQIELAPDVLAELDALAVEHASVPPQEKE